MRTPADDSIISGADRATDPAVRTFETLDGLRGVAALAVMFWHLPGNPIFHSGYLAVDLFFILSGFVIAYRYEARLTDNLDGRRFMMMRMIRLYPLYLLGSLIGAAWALIGFFVHDELSRVFGWLKRVGYTVLMIPDVWSGGAVYPFNYPAWSLFYEVFVNAIYGFTAHVSNVVLTTIIAVSASILAVAVFYSGNMHFTIFMPEFLLGFLRASFGFYVGIAIYRMRERNLLPTWRVPPMLIAALLLVVLTIPREGPLAPWLTLAVVFVAFPLMVIVALHNEPKGLLARIFTLLGLLSFPVYAIHRPLFSIFWSAGDKLNISQDASSAIAIVASLVLSWMAMQFFDKPVRHWLTGRAKKYMRPLRQPSLQSI